MKKTLSKLVILEAYVYADKEVYLYLKDVYEKHPCNKNYESYRGAYMALYDSIEEYNEHLKSIKGGR